MSSISRLSPALGERPLRLEFARSALVLALVATGSTMGSAGCVFTPPPPLPEELEAQAAVKAEAAAAAAARAKDKSVAEGEGGEAGEGEGGAEGAAVTSDADAVLAANKENGDPVEGFFTLEAALAGVEGQGKLMAEIVTPRGSIRCELYEKVAPFTIANFVGLARGVRPFKNRETGAWAAGPYYDNTIFHRVIPGFVIQGGDPTGTGTGSPGYTILDELNPAYVHDSAGILSMANRGPNTGGSQFFITLGPTPSLDGKHTVFGRCDEVGTQLADDISIAPRDAADRPEQEERLERINIYRE